MKKKVHYIFGIKIALICATNREKKENKKKHEIVQTRINKQNFFPLSLLLNFQLKFIVAFLSIFRSASSMLEMRSLSIFMLQHFGAGHNTKYSHILPLFITLV